MWYLRGVLEAGKGTMVWGFPKLCVRGVSDAVTPKDPGGAQALI